MKKLLSLLMLLIFAGVGNVWADTETFVLNKDDWSKDNEKTQNGITVSFTSVSYQNAGSDFNGYAKLTKTSSFVVSGSVEITGVTITYGSVNAKNLTPDSGSFSDENKTTWTGSSTSITFDNTSTSNADTRIEQIVVTYSSASPSTNLGAPDYTNGYIWDFTNISLTNISSDNNWNLNGSKYPKIRN